MNKSMTREVTGYVAKSKPGLPSFVLSNETVDRVGDIVRADGWDLRAFKANPLALWQHDANQPIGTWQNVRVENKQLLGELKLASVPMGQLAQTLIDEGVLRAVSVGFQVKDYKPINEKEPYGGWDIKKAELFEVSLVSVPANASALLIAKRLGLSAEQRELIFATQGQSPGQQTSAVSGIHPVVQRALDTREAIRALLENRK